MFCTNCGKKIYEGDHFCAHCGAKVRARAAEGKPSGSDVVFHPPFKIEAERRTSEIYRGFAAEVQQEEKVRQTEPVSFNWNLDGFPQEPRRTEEVNFNWDSVIERRNRQQREAQEPEERPAAPLPVVDKIDLREMQEPEEAVRVRTPLFTESVLDSDWEEPFFAEPSEPSEPEPETAPEKTEPETPELPKEPGMEEILTLDEIPSLILPEDAEVHPSAEPCSPDDVPAPILTEEEPAMTAEELERELFGENYRGIGAMAPEEAVKNTAQLEKFYTYNKKNEEFQQLLDQEYERLCGMEAERRPDEESLEFTWATSLFPEPSHGKAGAEEAAEASPEKDGAAAEEPAAEEPAVLSDTLDFSAVREEARRKKQQETADSAETEPEPEVLETEHEPEASETPEPAEQEADAAEPADSDHEEVPDAAPCTEEPEPEQRGSAAEDHDEKAKLRYSDVFPRESLADHSDAGSAAASVTAAKVSEIFEDDEEDEPKKMNIIVKLIILLLVLLILAEGVILLAKFIAPDSAFSQKADVLIETLMDRITGGDGSSGLPEDEGESSPVSADGAEPTYISDLLAEKIELPDSIGAVLEDADLRYESGRDYAFEEIAETEPFVNGDWLTGEDGETVTYAEGILDAVTGYYGQWQATNRDTSLIGINKLEIGEIRTGEMGYYVLCRLTFAGADGEEVAEYVTACVKISQNSMLLNEIKEEKL